MSRKEKQSPTERKKKNPLVLAKAAEEAQKEKIPKDLQDQMGAIEACATAFNVLDKGYFPHSYGNAVKASLNFLKLLHAQSVEEALKHPQAMLVPELKEAMETRVENGETEKQ